MKRVSLFLAAALVLAVGCKPTQQAPKLNPNAVKLEMFVMSQCPFGVQAIDNTKEAIDKLGPDVDFTIDYIGDIGANGELTSMHGADEVTGNIAQLCAKKLAPASYRDFVGCQNKTFREVAKNWEACATETKISVEKLGACLNGEEGKALLKASFERAKARGASGSPTIFLAGKPYSGRRGSNDVMRAVCAEFKEPTPVPEVCSQIPESPKVTVRVLSDKNCADCNADRFTHMLKVRLANPVITTVDYNDEEGKKLYAEAGGEGMLPMLLFDASLDADKEGSQMFARHMRPAGAYRALDVGSKWNPVCAAEGGCKLEQCANTMGCRKEVPGQLEVFVMSQCPFGVRALNAMPEVLKAFGKELDFKVHFIATGTAEKGFSALHGQPEVDENIRELCAIKLYGKNNNYMDYVLCRNQDIRSDKWQECATSKTGIDAKAMQKCIDNDGKKLHENDIKIANALGIGGSPTWIINGKNQFSGVDAETIHRNICQHNPKFKGCSVKLAAPAADAAPSAPAGSCGQ